MRGEKGSLNLSLNFLVILILAIAILGLALSFTRGVFSDMEAKVKVAVSSTELSNPPTKDNPITTTPFKVEVKQGENTEIIVAFMNIEPETLVYTLDVTNTEGDSCQTAGNCVVPMQFSTADYSMRGGQINTWAMIFHPVRGDSPTQFGNYLYTANVICGAAQGCSTELRRTIDFEVIVTT